MITKIHFKRAPGKHNSYVAFEDEENNKWYFIGGTELAVAKNSLNDTLDSVEANQSLIDDGPGRVFKDEAAELKVLLIEKEGENFTAVLSDGTTLEVSPIELKTLFQFT